MVETMATNRPYGDGCAIATALDYVGERWALLVVRELLLGPKRFTDLQDGLSGAGPKVLAQRLRELEGAGVVRRRTLPAPSGDHVGADSVMIKLRSFFRPQPERPWTATYEMRLGRHRFTTRVVDGHLVEMSRGEPHDRPDTTIDTDPDTLNCLVGADQALNKAINN